MTALTRLLARLEELEGKARSNADSDVAEYQMELDRVGHALIQIVRVQGEALAEIEDLPPLQERERRTIAREAQARAERLAKGEG